MICCSRHSETVSPFSTWRAAATFLSCSHSCSIIFSYTTASPSGLAQTATRRPPSPRLSQPAVAQPDSRRTWVHRLPALRRRLRSPDGGEPVHPGINRGHRNARSTVDRSRRECVPAHTTLIVAPAVDAIEDGSGFLVFHFGHLEPGTLVDVRVCRLAPCTPLPGAKTTPR